MDYLKEMLSLQDKLNAAVGVGSDAVKNMTDDQKTRWLINYNSAQVCESGEFWKSSCGRWWRDKPENWIEESKEELIDEFHFWMSKAIILGMTSKEIYEIYCRKNKKNFERPDWHHKHINIDTLEKIEE